MADASLCGRIHRFRKQSADVTYELKWRCSVFSESSLKYDQSALQTERHVRCVVVNMRLFDWLQLPLTHSRFMSAYRWRRGLHLACSGSKSCACVTALRPCMRTDFLLWHLIWLTWHQQATAASHNCHLLTEQGNRNRKRRKRPSSRGGGDERESGNEEGDLCRTGDIWTRSYKTHTEREASSFCVVLEGWPHHSFLMKFEANVVWVIYCLEFSFCNSINLEHIEMSFILLKSIYKWMLFGVKASELNLLTF